MKNFNNKGFHMSMRVPNKDDLYYDAMEAIDAEEYKSAEKLLLDALVMDSDYVQTYIGLVNLYSVWKKTKKTQENIKIAFEKTKQQFPKWPRKMLWGYLENRAYLRAIQYQADLFADNGDNDNAINLYKLILRLNPNDNQGVRYLVAGLYAGIRGEKINQMFDEGNRKQDWSKLEKLVADQNKIYKFWKKSKVY